MFLHAIQSAVQAGDYITFCDEEGRKELIYGMITECSQERLGVNLFKEFTSEVMRRHFIRPINANDHPLTFQDNIVELYQANESRYISRANITDVVFVIPVAEIESGMFFLSGAANVFCIRYALLDGRMQCFPSSYYFSRYMVEPISVRLFNALNTLSQHLRKSLFHQTESSPSKKTCRLPLFPMEAFWYLMYRVGRPGIGTSCHRKQSLTKYYSTLRMECSTKKNTVCYLRILSQPALDALRLVLGVGIGLGVSRRRPTKANPLQFCTIGSILTSVEVGPEPPFEVVLKPDCNVSVNGIDFIYTESNRCLSCIIRFSKVVVSDEAVATSRLAAAEVVANKVSGVYLNVWFKHNNRLMEVVAINEENNMITCSYVEEVEEDVVLPLNLVEELVSMFGQA
jgi:hypothetical protein